MLKKFLLIFICSLCLAEESSYFFGVDALDFRINEELSTSTLSYKNRDVKGHRMGILLGYKHFFNESFGFRIYGNFNYGSLIGEDMLSKKGFFVKSANFLTHLDALYNFCKCYEHEVGLYTGISLGYINYDIREQGYINAFDSALSLGFRISFIGGHSFELYRRFGLPINASTYKFNHIKIHQADNTGIRYFLHF